MLTDHWRPGRSEVLLAGGLLLLAEGEALWGGYDHRGALLLGGLGMAAAFLMVRTAPVASVVALVLVLAAVSASGATTNTVAVVVAYVLWSYSLGAHARPPAAAVGLLLLLGSSWAAILTSRQDAGAGDLIFVTILLAGAAGLGRALRRRGHEVATLEEQAELAEAERERRAREAVLEERSRIARELHDVVAHSVSVMVMQTGVVRRRLATPRPDDAELLDEVERTGRDALGELRRLLGLLRTDEEELALSPQPGIDRVGPLIESVREAGLDVDLRVEGEAVPLPPGLDLAAYRVVQEGLTNALKHAGRVHATVLLRYGQRDLELEIADDGAGRSGSNGRPRLEGAGHGLVGMRERVALYGGTLVTGARPEGGYLVRAVLPLEPAR